ncbi:MAG: hypothetical protein B6A08_16635 [Sorangiineae bacterium NIC37A_2]|nr:MAG: hypothetical protein B6A08_16635 [Sorangiineae bacterium NIC37A_2]
MSLQLNDTIDGKYRIVRLLGEGGMGAVYEGENTRIHRRVAIKVLHSGVAQSKDAVERFEREAQAAGRIGSEHIVEVLDLGNLPNGDRYMVMEFLEGESLAERIASRGRLDARLTAELAVQLLEGLGAAHEAGIVHRDLKPDNVFLLASRRGKKDFVKIVDFGISKFSAMSGDFSMTRTGVVMGTPYYMSPEQAKGDRTVDHRADLYAVGVILYEAVTGKVPFDADTFNELLFKIVLENPPPIQDKVREVDARFSEIVQKAMAKDRDQRYSTAAEFQADLIAYLDQATPLQKESTAHAGTPLRALDATQALPQVPAEALPVQEKEQKPQAQTLGTWAHTQGGDVALPEIPGKSGPSKVVIGAGAGVLALVAVVALALGRGGESEGGLDTSLTPAASSAAEVSPPPIVPSPVEKTPETATKEVPPPAVPEVRAEAEDDKTAPVAPPSEQKAAAAPAQAPATKAAVKTSTTKASTSTKAPAQQPGTEKPASSSPTSNSGRKIRTTL